MSQLHVTLLRTPAVIAKSSMNSSSVVPSLALGYLSAVLVEANYKVTTIDAQLQGIGKINNIKNVENFVSHGLPDLDIINLIPSDTNLLGISVMFSSEWPYVRELIKKIKLAYPHLFIIAGGEHITAIPEFTLRQSPEINIAVLGEGEETLLELIKAIQNKEDLKQIDGIALIEATKYYQTSKRKRIKAVNDIPWPRWSDDDLDKFFASKQSHGPYKGRTMPIMASRGCPYDCQFCSNRTMWGNFYWSRDPKDVVDEIEHYIKRYNIKCFEFMDLTVYMKKKWIIDFCNQLIDRDIKVTWQCTGGTRTEAIDEEIIELTKKAGCTYLGFAPESGSEKILIDIKKKIKLPRMIKLYKLMKKHKVGTRANLIIGFPDETRKDIFYTIFLQMKLALLGVLDAPLFIFTPYPGSEFFRLLQKRKIIPDINGNNTKEIDNYFYELAQDFGTVDGKSYNSTIKIRELRIYQNIGMMAFYITQYIFNPKRLFNFIKNIISGGESNSVFEQRIMQHLKITHKK